VLAELDGEAVERAGLQAGQEALDDEAGAQVEAGDLADDLGLQVLLGLLMRVIVADGRAGEGSRPHP
jgi:hypothetical protein